MDIDVRVYVRVCVCACARMCVFVIILYKKNTVQVRMRYYCNSAGARRSPGLYMHRARPKSALTGPTKQ